jgi:radical SAM superfamily enzyme YgiQ (UPF0313 family)
MPLRSKTRRVALLCIDPWIDNEGVAPNFRPFNYSVRKIQAALSLESSVEVELLETRSSDPNVLFEQLRATDADLVGASAYVWSLPTLVEVARLYRSVRDDAAIVFGGPSARPAMFDLAPFRGSAAHVDALALGEGEDVIREIARLPSLSRDALSGVAGLAVSTGDGWRTTSERALPGLDALPSPYQLGLVSAQMTAHLETFRGCPLSCAFCQWGDYGGKSRAFSVDYLERELLGFRAAEARGVFLVDAALNLSAPAFRNLRDAEKRVGYLRDKHFHAEVYPAHLTDDHLRFLQDIRADAVGIGLQSLDREVLRKLQRPLDIERFERVAYDLASVVPNVHVELIMGLPGDNPSAFQSTVERVRALPVSVRIYHCLVLPDALMTRAPPGLEMDFDPITLEMRQCTGWSRDALERTSDDLTRQVRREGGNLLEGTRAWTFTPRASSRDAHSSHATAAESNELDRRQLDEIARRATQGRVSVVSAHMQKHALRVTIRHRAGELVFDAALENRAPRSFRVIDGVAFSYQASTLDHDLLRDFSTLIVPMALVARRILDTLPDRASLPIVS